VLLLGLAVGLGEGWAVDGVDEVGVGDDGVEVVGADVDGVDDDVEVDGAGEDC
jgi:hypothetical protein